MKPPSRPAGCMMNIIAVVLLFVGWKFLMNEGGANFVLAVSIYVVAGGLVYWAMDSRPRHCPYCLKKVKRHVLKCPHCHQFIGSDKPKTKRNNIGFQS